MAHDPDKILLSSLRIHFREWLKENREKLGLTDKDIKNLTVNWVHKNV